MLPIIKFGDNEQRKHMKSKEPIKGNGMKTLFHHNNQDSRVRVFYVVYHRLSSFPSYMIIKRWC